MSTPTAIFAGNVTFAATANTFLQSSLVVTTQETYTVNKDRAYETLSVASNNYETLYESQDVANQVADTVYFYAHSNPSNFGTMRIYYTSGSADVQIAELRPGEWMFFPYHAQANHPDSSSLKVYNASPSSSVISVIYGESGSL